jgi:hypothetical protein
MVNYKKYRKPSRVVQPYVLVGILEASMAKGQGVDSRGFPQSAEGVF